MACMLKFCRFSLSRFLFPIAQPFLYNPAYLARSSPARGGMAASRPGFRTQQTKKLPIKSHSHGPRVQPGFSICKPVSTSSPDGELLPLSIENAPAAGGVVPTLETFVCYENLGTPHSHPGNEWGSTDPLLGLLLRHEQAATECYKCTFCAS